MWYEFNRWMQYLGQRRPDIEYLCFTMRDSEGLRSLKSVFLYAQREIGWNYDYAAERGLHEG